MATVEEYTQRLQQAIAGAEDLGPMTPTEWDRRLRDHVALSLGSPRPSLRTAIDLRVFGDGVQGHDLDAALAGVILLKFAGLVSEVANRATSIRHAPRLYISPIIQPGSTILTVYGSAIERPSEENPLEVPETPLDRTMVEVFSVLGRVTGLSDDARPTDIKLNPHVGDQVFGLANELIDNGLDLDITWTRVSGASRRSTFDRPVAKRVRRLLDEPVVTTRNYSDPGTLTSISTDGMIRVVVSGRRWRVLDMQAPDTELETLRELFGSAVRIAYRRISTKHPGRTRDEVSHEFVEIRPWENEPTDETLL